MNERVFLDDIAEHPDDAGLRRIFADWLEDRGDPRAELLRMQAECIDGEDDELEVRVKRWLKSHGHDWLGTSDKQPLGYGFAMSLVHDEVEVMEDDASDFMQSAEWEGLRRCLSEGWIRLFRLTFWDDGLIEKAAKRGLLNGPGELEVLGGTFTDKSLRWVATASRVRALSLGGDTTAVTDRGLASLAGLTRLRRLDLWSLNRLTGSGLSHLSGLTGLRRLSFSYCPKVGNAVLAHVRAFSALEELSLSYCGQVTDAGVSHLTALTALRDLTLRECEHLTDAGLEHVAKLNGLRSLYLAQCSGITDAGLAGLAALRQLENLNLYDCKQITGAGIVHLYELKNLKWLQLTGCKLEPHETRALRKALPDCEVLRNVESAVRPLE
jgi:uncharacterized protein (TIGR02996 family)